MRPPLVFIEQIPRSGGRLGGWNHDGRTPRGIVKLKLTAVFDAQHGGFTTGWSPASWGLIDELFVNLTMPSALPDPLAPAARCPAPAKGRRHVPNNMGQCPISIQVFFPDAPRSCEGMDSPCVQAEAGVRMPLTRRPGPRSVPARCRRRATRGQRLQRFCAAVGAGPARAPRPRPRGRPPERARRTPVPSHTARRRWSSELRP